MDLVIVRENTEGFYSDRNMHEGTGEFMPDPDLSLSVRQVSARVGARIAHAAFALAEDRRKKVTAVYQANVLKLSDGLFLCEVRAVTERFPDVEPEELIVDAVAEAGSFRSRWNHSSQCDRIIGSVRRSGTGCAGRTEPSTRAGGRASQR
jgi:isocitrate/isopropylmalate dehydrogenase